MDLKFIKEKRTMGRKLAREETMKLLYQMDINNDFFKGSLSYLLDQTIFQKMKLNI